MDINAEAFGFAAPKEIGAKYGDTNAPGEQYVNLKQARESGSPRTIPHVYTPA